MGFVTITCVILAAVHICDCTKLNFIGLSMGAPSTAPGPLAVEPAFSLALEAMHRKYVGLFANYTWSTRSTVNDSACTVSGREHAVKYMAWLYEERRVTTGQAIILTSLNCPLAFDPVGDMARELDIFIGTCGAANFESGALQARFPTVVSFSYADISTYTIVVLHVLRHFGWKSIVLINDDRTGDPFAPRNTELCRGMVDLLPRVVPEVNYLELRTDSAKQHFNVTLLTASLHSRIIFCSMSSLVIRELLEVAADSGMTTGDYIFIALYVMEVPGSPPPIYWFKNTTDGLAEKALPTLLVIRSATVNWTRLKSVTDRIAQRRSELTKIPVPPAMRLNEVAVLCADMVGVIAQALNGTSTNDTTAAKGGRDLASRMQGQTFQSSLTGTSVSFSHRRARITFPEVQQYDPGTKQFRTILTYDSSTSRLSSTGSYTPKWKDGTVPPDRPRCFHAEQCRVDDARAQSLIGSVIATVAVIVLLFIVTFLYILRLRTGWSSTWWLLVSEQLGAAPLLPSGYSFLRSGYSVRTSPDSHWPLHTKNT